MIAAVRKIANIIRTRPLLSRWVLRAIPDLPITLNIRGIGPMRVRLRRNRSLLLREPMISERFPFAMLARLVRTGDVVYDCGANLGLYARHLLCGLGAGRVVAFEPVPDNLALLEINLRLGGIADRVVVVPVALADEDGWAPFQEDDFQSASGTLDKVTGGKPCLGRQNLGLGALTRQVPVRRLDSIVAEGQLPMPDVVKIDVEGAEAMLLQGATELLRDRSPRLLIELHGAPVAREVLRILLDLQYSCVAKVSERLDASGFAPVDASSLDQIHGLYDVHFLAASRQLSDLPERWGPE